MAGPLVLPEIVVGIAEQSTTLSPLTPCTRSRIEHGIRLRPHAAGAGAVEAGAEQPIRRLADLLVGADRGTRHRLLADIRLEARLLHLARHAEAHMPSDRPGMVMRKRLLALLHEHGEEEATRSSA